MENGHLVFHFNREGTIKIGSDIILEVAKEDFGTNRGHIRVSILAPKSVPIKRYRKYEMPVDREGQEVEFKK